jgi:DNA-binding transcriptional LysR family regulator
MIDFRLVKHLWLFLAVAEEQHFGRAARRLSMSQPPLSEQIQVLELALGVKLFVRSRRGAQLTPVGAAILPAVRKFAAQMEQLEGAVREAVSGHEGTLTIGAISSAMFEILPPILDRLRSAQPRLSISVREIDSADAVPALASRTVDLAFARLEGALGPSIQSIALARDRLAVALPAAHPMARSTRIRLASLADAVFVMFARQVSPVYFDNVIAACRGQGFSPRILHEVRTVASQVAFVGCGQGVALVPLALRRLAPEHVVVRPLAEKVDVVTTAVAWNQETTNPAVPAALAVIRSVAGHDAYAGAGHKRRPSA